jgi:hypothetical protein
MKRLLYYVVAYNFVKKDIGTFYHTKDGYVFSCCDHKHRTVKGAYRCLEHSRLYYKDAKIIGFYEVCDCHFEPFENSDCRSIK